MMPDLSRALSKERDNDLDKIIRYYKDFSPDSDVFSDNNLGLLRLIHGFAFSLGLWQSKLEAGKIEATVYFQELRSDIIQLIPSIIFGNKRSFRLYQRSAIEDFLRYIFYYHHPIEHIILQDEPTTYASMDNLFSWVKHHPWLREFRDESNGCCDELNSAYSSISRSVHATTVKEFQLSDEIISLHAPFVTAGIILEFRSVSEAIMFLLCSFHKQKFHEFDLNERRIIMEFIRKGHKKTLLGLI